MIDPVAFSIFGLEIHWYGIVYALGFLAGVWFMRKNSSYLNITKENADTITITTMILCVIGGRLFYVLFYDPIYYLNNIVDIIRIDMGGLSIHGGLFFGTLSLICFSKKYKISLGRLTDLALIPLTLTTVFGRIANFINQELVGKVTSSNIGVVFPQYDSQNRFPSQLFESAKNMVVFQVLLYMHYFKSLKPGTITGFFLIMYNGLRFVVDFAREPTTLVIGIPMGQILNLIGFILGVILLIYLRFNVSNKKLS